MPRITDDERARFHARLDECIDKLNWAKNAKKVHWSTQSNEDLFKHLSQEIFELHEATITDSAFYLEDECKDVANIALMIFDNVRGNK